MKKRSRITITFDPVKGTVAVKAINTKDDRKIIHEAFKRALKKSKFKTGLVTDVGETTDVRPIRKEKEELTELQSDLALE